MSYRRFTGRKYGNVKATYDGITFDSIKECNRYRELKALEEAGEIHDLQRQVRYELLAPQRREKRLLERGVYYVADFVYKLSDGRTVCEDTKGYKTREYVIKRKLLLYRYDIQIKEI